MVLGEACSFSRGCTYAEKSLPRRDASERRERWCSVIGEPGKAPAHGPFFRPKLPPRTVAWHCPMLSPLPLTCLAIPPHHLGFLNAPRRALPSWSLRGLIVAMCTFLLALQSRCSQRKKVTHKCSAKSIWQRKSPRLSSRALILLGWLTGLEPATTGITIRDSTD